MFYQCTCLRIIWDRQTSSQKAQMAYSGEPSSGRSMVRRSPGSAFGHVFFSSQDPTHGVSYLHSSGIGMLEPRRWRMVVDDVKK